MSIILNNGVQNIKGTPGIIQDSFVNIPAATSVANGTIFIDTVSLNILINLSGIWTLLYASGSTPNLDQVVAAGNAVNDQTIEIYDTTTSTLVEIGGSFISIILFPNVRLSQYYDRLEIADYSTTLRQVSLYADKLRWIETTGGTRQDLFPNTTFAGQVVYLPESNGTIALQDEPLQASINSTPFTPSGTFNKIYRVVAGASSIVLNPANWIDRKTLTFCFDVTAVTFSVTGGATLRGIALINNTGLYYVTYLSSANTFYLSHTA